MAETGDPDVGQHQPWWQRVSEWWQDRRPRTEGPQRPPVTHPGALPQPNTELVLSSCDPYLDFTVRAHVGCSWDGSGDPHPAPVSVAKEGIARRADEFSARRTLAEAQRLRGELEVELWQPEQVAGTAVLAWAHSISVAADPELVEAVRARAASQRREQVAALEQQHRRERERHYGALLADPVRATTWWFAENPDRPEQLVEMATAFRGVRDVLRPEVEAGGGRDALGAVLDDFSADVGAAEVALLTTHLVRFFEELGRGDLADRVRRIAERVEAEQGAGGSAA